MTINDSDEAITTRLRPGSTFLTTTAEQLGVHIHRYIVPAGALLPSVYEMQSDLVEDIARAVCPEDGE